MATQYTGGQIAGGVLTSATMNSIGAVWETWTPVWTATTTNPALGNGTLTGRYCRINKTVIATGALLVGSTTTFGTGEYRLSLPFGGYVGSDGTMAYGSLLDASAGFTNYTGTAIQSGGNLMAYRIGNAQLPWTPTVPITLATSDQFRFTYIYEAS